MVTGAVWTRPCGAGTQRQTQVSLVAVVGAMARHRPVHGAQARYSGLRTTFFFFFFALVPVQACVSSWKTVYTIRRVVGLWLPITRRWYSPCSSTLTRLNGWQGALLAYSCSRDYP